MALLFPALVAIFVEMKHAFFPLSLCLLVAPVACGGDEGNATDPLSYHDGYWVAQVEVSAMRPENSWR